MREERFRRGFTRAELLALLGVGVVVAGLVATAALAAGRRRLLVDCRSNLQQLHKLVLLYSTAYGGYLPAFWHERWVGELQLAGGAWPPGNKPHDWHPKVPKVWDNPVPNPIGGFPVRSGAPFLVCPNDKSTWRCDQGCHVSYMGLAKYGWWHRSTRDPKVAMFEYHQVQEFDHVARRVLFAETEPGTWQYGTCGCRWFVTRHPTTILDRHDGGGNLLFFDGHMQFVRDPEKRAIRYWEPDYEKVNPGL